MEKELTPELCHRFVDTVIRINHMHRNVCDAYIDSIGIHRHQHMVLVKLSRGEKITSQKALADAFGISPAAITVILKKLEKAGYISRACSETDNRYNEIRITEAGLALVQESQKIFSGIDAVMLEGFSPEEVEQMTELLLRVKENLSFRTCENFCPEMKKQSTKRGKSV